MIVLQRSVENTSVSMSQADTNVNVMRDMYGGRRFSLAKVRPHNHVMFLY